MGSTVVFVAQNLWSKKLLGHALSGGAASSGRRASQGGAHDVKLDKINILFWSSAVSVVLMLPMLFYTDVPKLLAAARASRDVDLAPHLAAAAGLDQHALPLGSANATLNSAAALSVAASPSQSQGWKVIQLLLSNGVVHFSQNLLAFSVLGLTSPVTYSIASLFKRVFVICFAILWFGQTVTSVQWLGIVLTFVGLYLYNDSKQRPTPGSAEDKGGVSTGKGRMKSRDGIPMVPSRDSMAAAEDEAARHFGMDKGTRRTTGILPTMSGGSGNGGPDLGFGGLGGSGGAGVGRDPAAGPIWKGMSSNSSLFAQGGHGHAHTYVPGQGQAQGASENPYSPSHGAAVNGSGLPKGHGSPYANANGYVNGGHGRVYPQAQVESKGKEGPKRD